MFFLFIQLIFYKMKLEPLIQFFCFIDTLVLVVDVKMSQVLTEKKALYLLGSLSVACSQVKGLDQIYLLLRSFVIYDRWL